MSDTNTNKSEDSIIVIFEGQQYPVEREIAEDDNKLRALLSPFAPAAASAKIERVPGQPIKMTKQSGTKGASPLTILCNTPETLNPAIAMARQIQHLELSGGIGIDEMEAIARDIETAIARGTEAIEDYRASLERLKQLPSCATVMPIGF